MGLRSKLMGSNSKVAPGQMTLNRSSGWDSDDDSTSAGSSSTGVPTPDSGSIRSGFFSGRLNLNTPRESSAHPTPRGTSHRRRPLIDPSSPTSPASRSSSVKAPDSPWTRAAPFVRRGGRARNDVSHLIAPVQPWNEFIDAYTKNLSEKVGGRQQAWTDVMTLSTHEVRTALNLSMITPRGSNKPRQMPDEMRRVVSTLLDSLPTAYRNDTAKLTFALHERPFFQGALQKHVELVLWGIIAARNDWM